MARPRKKAKPTFEERMDAITQTLELVALMQIQNEKQLTRMEKFAEKTDKKLDRLAQFTLTNVVSQHKRIKKLEDKR